MVRRNDLLPMMLVVALAWRWSYGAAAATIRLEEETIS